VDGAKSSRYRRVVFRFERFLPAPLTWREGVRVLEIGTGDGSTILQLATWAREAGVRGEFVGIDREPARAGLFTQAAAAAGLSDIAWFEQQDAFRISPHLGVFDLIVCFDCISQFAFDRFPEGVPTDIRVRLADGLFAHWRTLIGQDGLLLVAEVDRDTPGDADARGVALFEQEKWPLVPPAVIEEAVLASGFESIIAKCSPYAEDASREDMERRFGAGRYRRLPRHPFRPSPFAPRVPDSCEGVHRLTWRVLQARRAPPENPPAGT